MDNDKDKDKDKDKDRDRDRDRDQDREKADRNKPTGIQSVVRLKFTFFISGCQKSESNN
jgi:hypothetical protein